MGTTVPVAGRRLPRTAPGLGGHPGAPRRPPRVRVGACVRSSRSPAQGADTAPVARLDARRRPHRAASFWHDRRPRRTVVLPGTATPPASGAALGGVRAQGRGRPGDRVAGSAAVDGGCPREDRDRRDRHLGARRRPQPAPHPRDHASSRPTTTSAGTRTPSRSSCPTVATRRHRLRRVQRADLPEVPRAARRARGRDAAERHELLGLRATGIEYRASNLARSTRSAPTCSDRASSGCSSTSSVPIAACGRGRRRRRRTGGRDPGPVRRPARLLADVRRPLPGATRRVDLVNGPRPPFSTSRRLVRTVHGEPRPATTCAARPLWRTVTGGVAPYVSALDRPIRPPHPPRHAVHKIVRDPPRSTRTLPARSRSSRMPAPIASTASCSQPTATSPSACSAIPPDAEREILGAIRYQPNVATLHCDDRFLPRNPRARASWNYHVGAADGRVPTLPTG